LGSDRLFTKAWCSTRLAKVLEPWVVKKASLITGINRKYYQGMLDRNPNVAGRAVLSEMQYGGSEKDHEFVRQHPRPAALFAGHAEKFNLVYAGAMLPRAYPVLERLFEGLVLLRQRHPRLAAEFQLHFIGTGKSPDDPEGYNIRPTIERHGLQDCVSEYPRRLPYLDVLAHLDAASGVLVLGSTEPHYSPSKIFQSVMSRRPVLALLHEESTAVTVLRSGNAGPVLTLTEKMLPTVEAVADELEGFIYRNRYAEAHVHWEALEKYSARESARLLASALDEAVTVKKS
jgi:glycosyltransferase involved in cell wall biosynthesis